MSTKPLTYCKLLFVICTVFFSCSLSAQSEIIKFESQIRNLKSIAAHKNFWSEIYMNDQFNRGVLTDVKLDRENLIKVSIYFNKFGYPKREELGQNSQILSLVFSHNKYPRVRKLAFPFIYDGFLNKAIDEKSFRTYYLRSIYRRTYGDTLYRIKPILEMIKSLDLDTSDNIDIEQLIKTFNEEERFLKRPKSVIGIWKQEDTISRIAYMDTFIVNKIKRSPVRIFRSEDKQYYFHKMYADGSHYPQKLIPLNDEYTKFKLFNNTENYLLIKNDGDLYYIEEKNEVRFIKLIKK